MVNFSLKNVTLESERTNTKTLFWVVRIVRVRFVITNATEAKIVSCKLLVALKNVIKISRHGKNGKVDYKISKLSDWSICLDGAEQGASFQKK